MKIPLGKIAGWMLSTLITAGAQLAADRLSRAATRAPKPTREEPDNG